MVGRVARADRGSCEVLAPRVSGTRGAELVTLSAAWGPGLERAVSHDPTRVPAAGDWVVAESVDDSPAEEARLVLTAVLPRRTAVVRAQADGSSHGQVLAANADVVAVVEGMVPDLDEARIERLLALAWSSGARPVVVLTKADLARDPGAVRDDVVLLAPGADVLAVSTPSGDGLEALHAHLAAGATIALLGASGVGKSTLLNALVAGEVGTGPMATRSLGAEGKGRHTTVTRELHLGPVAGAVLDTPGMRTIGLAGHTDVETVFPEIEELAAACRFRDCEHRTEPGCAVLATVDAGDLPLRRLLSFRKLLREAAWQASRTDARLRAELVRPWKEHARAARAHPKRR